VSNTEFTGVMWKQDTVVKSHDYWKNNEGSHCIWNDGGTGTSEDWIFGSLSNLGTRNGRFYSNKEAEYPWEVYTWYRGDSLSSNRIAENSVEKFEVSKWKSTVEKITAAVSNAQGNRIFNRIFTNYFVNYFR